MKDSEKKLGIVVLAYSGISFPTPGKPIEFLGMHIATTDNHFIPPVVGALALVGGIVLLVDRMNRILEIDETNQMAVVEPGVVTAEINVALAPFGLFYAGYPMSRETCYIGGNVAENAGGGKAVKYGVTGRYITGLEVVTPTGDPMTQSLMAGPMVALYVLSIGLAWMFGKRRRKPEE